jgi:hypothetical protein
MVNSLRMRAALMVIVLGRAAIGIAFNGGHHIGRAGRFLSGRGRGGQGEGGEIGALGRN